MNTPKQTSKAVPILIGCGAVLLFFIVVGGVLAAIAIPAFLRSVKKSKAVESTVVMRQIADYATSEYATTCAFPPSARRTLDPIPEGGAKGLPSNLDESWSSYPIAMVDPTYFSYSTRNEGETFVIIAEANFKPGEPHHTVELHVIKEESADAEGCRARVLIPMTRNEFE